MDTEELLAAKRNAIAVLEKNQASPAESTEAVRGAHALIAAITALEAAITCTLEKAVEEGSFFVPEGDFESYAHERARDLGTIDSEDDWPCNHIDWEAATAELREAAQLVEYEGARYLFIS